MTSINDINLDTVLVACKHSWRAYEDISNNNVSTLYSDATTDAQMLITFIDDGKFSMLISFRGTSSVQDMVTNFDLRMNRCDGLYGDPKIRVHAGFLRQYYAMRDKMLLEIDHFCPESLLFGSHSLGGAIATLATLDLSINRPNVKVMNVTFGCPRVGNRAFCRLFKRTVDIRNNIRCIHGSDIIPQTPLPIRFKHAKGTILCIPKTTRTPRYKWIPCIADHMIDVYYSALEVMSIKKLTTTYGLD
jgi:predicted lipase